jgi:PAS domain S-box-containing protein
MKNLMPKTSSNNESAIQQAECNTIDAIRNRLKSAIEKLSIAESIIVPTMTVNEAQQKFHEIIDEISDEFIYKETAVRSPKLSNDKPVVPTIVASNSDIAYTTTHDEASAGNCDNSSSVNKSIEERLRAANTLLELTGELAKIGGWQVELSTMRLIWTKEVFRISERESQVEPTLDQGINLFAPTARPEITAAVKSAINHGIPYDLELPIITEKGNYRWVRTQGWAMVENGVRTRLIGTIQDITKEKEVISAYNKLNVLHASVFDSLAEHVAVLDQDGVIVSVNQAWKNYGFKNNLKEPQQSCLGKNYLEICRAAGDVTSLRTLEGIELVLSGEKSLFTIEYPCHSPHEQAWFQLRVTPVVIGITAHGGSGVSGGGAVVSHMNITERKLAEAVKHAAFCELENYQFALDKHAIVAVTDIRGIINYVNDAFCSISGYSRFELLGKDHRIINSSYHPKAFFKELWATIKPGKVWHGEICNKTKKGDLYWVKTTIAPLNRVNGEIRGFIAVRTDITHRKLEAERLAHEKQRIEQLNHELQLSTIKANELSKKAHEASEIKSAFVANVSHEIRTPMNGVMGMLEVLLKTPLNDEQKDYAMTAYSCAEGLLTIVDDILDFSKIEACRLEIRPVSCDINDVIFSALSVFRSRLSQSLVEFFVEIAPDVPAEIFADAGRIRQIIINLLSNSFKFTKQGFIRLSVSCQGANIIISVKDSGIGISAHHQAQLFTAFTQADSSSKRYYGGTGLGLVISRRLAELMQGTLTVNSSEGQGSTFTLSVPIVSPEMPDVETTRNANVLKAYSNSPLLDKHLFVVVNNQENAAIICQKIKYLGAQSTSCDDASLALAKLKESIVQGSPFDAVIVDLRAPGMTNYEFACAIRSDTQLSHIRLLAMSNFGQPQESVAMAKAGFNAYVVKPIRISTFQNVLTRILSADYSMRAEMIRDYPVTSPATKSDVTLASLHNAKVLLVEDNDINARIAALALTKAGFVTSLAKNGREAVKACNENSYDVILMDCQMPEMDGFEATAAIRAQEKMANRKPVPIIALTASIMGGAFEKCLAAGMNDCLGKPFKIQQLEEKINVWLSGNQSLAAKTVKQNPELSMSLTPPNTPMQMTPEKNSPTEDFDPAYLRDIDNATPGMAMIIFTAFTTKLGSEVAAISRANCTTDLPDIKRMAHKLKGSSGSVGAIALWKIASELEAVALSGDSERCQSLITELKQFSYNFTHRITPDYLGRLLTHHSPTE